MIAQAQPVSEFSLDTMLPDLLRQYPQARPVFDRYGLRGCGGDFGPVETLRFFARTHGVEESRLLRELAVAVASPIDATPVVAPTFADAIYRRFFLGGLAVILSVGAGWGAYILWQIGLRGSFTGAGLQAINAHGHAQIYGWVGLFIMGFSLQAFPRLWHTELWRPKLAIAAFVLLLAGLVTRTTGMVMDGAAGALAVAMAGGALEIAAVLLYAGVLVRTFLGSEARSQWKTQPYLGFIFASLSYFALSSIFDVWHLWNTLRAATHDDLLWYVATYQAPLRDMQIHGLALCMIFGVALRMLPPLFELPEISVRRGWWAFGLINAAVLSEVVIFIAYRWTNVHAVAALLMLPWLALATGIGLVAIPWRVWRPFKVQDRSAKFVRAGFAWLPLSILMLLLLPVYQSVSGIPFSHAYYGAIRHAITVGFVSLLIMGVAAKVVPTLNGLDPRQLGGLWAPFILVNVGCFLRVLLQVLTDWHPVFFSLVGVSGLLEVTGLLIWSWHLGSILLNRQPAESDASEARPQQIAAEHRVTKILDWFPETEPVFVAAGFGMLRNPVLRRTMARHITVAQACAMQQVPVTAFVEGLNLAAGLIAPELPEEDCHTCEHRCASPAG